jgi:hypothetical protein
MDLALEQGCLLHIFHPFYCPQEKPKEYVRSLHLSILLFIRYGYQVIHYTRTYYGCVILCHYPKQPLMALLCFEIPKDSQEQKQKKSMQLTMMSQKYPG